MRNSTDSRVRISEWIAIVPPFDETRSNIPTPVRSTPPRRPSVTSAVSSDVDDCRPGHRRDPPFPARDVPDLGDQGRPRVPAGHRLPARPAATGAKRAWALPADPDRRPDGQGRPAHGHVEHPAP